jgi:hypothetical protein
MNCSNYLHVCMLRSNFEIGQWPIFLPTLRSEHWFLPTSQSERFIWSLDDANYSFPVEGKDKYSIGEVNRSKNFLRKLSKPHNTHFAMWQSVLPSSRCRYFHFAQTPNSLQPAYTTFQFSIEKACIIVT